MNTFSFLIAFSAIVCGAFASHASISNGYHGGNGATWNNNGRASVRAWEEPAAPCDGASSGARVHVSTSSDYSGASLNEFNGLNGNGYNGLNGNGYNGLNGNGFNGLNGNGFNGLNGNGYNGATDLSSSVNGPCPPARTTYQQHPGFNQQNERGEIIIHRPAPIIVKRPPTKVLVNHPPLVVKPAPVVLHRPPPMVVKPVVVRHHPQPVKVEPVYVKVMKPATSEKYLLEDRHNGNNAGFAGETGFVGGDASSYSHSGATYSNAGASYSSYGHHNGAAVSSVDTGCH